MAVSLSQYWNACTKRDRAHAAGGDVDRPRPPRRRSPPTQGGAPVTVCSGQPGALQLRQQVEPADADHEARRRSGGPRRTRSGPRRSRAACRRRSGAAARRPAPAASGSRRCSRPRTTACRRRTTSTSPATPRNDAADRYSPLIAEAFQRGDDRAAGDVEVAGGARDPQAEQADPDRRQADHASRSRQTDRRRQRSPPPDELGELGSIRSALPDVEAGGDHDAPGRPARRAPAQGSGSPARTSVAGRRDQPEQQRHAAEHGTALPMHRQREPQLRRISERM